MKLVLIGYMGSGKSTIGKLLANALDYDFEDLDNVIASNEGSTIAEIFKIKGEIYFRKKEAIAINEVLSENDKLVLATGGGTPCYGSIIDDLNIDPEVITIYLKLGVDHLTKRLFQEKDMRPLIAHLETEELLNDFIRKHLFERSYYYSKAKLILNCEDLSPKEIVEQLVLKLV